MHGPRHALDDHALREAVVLVPDVAAFVDSGEASFPVCEFTRSDVQDEGGLAAFAEGG